MREIPHDAHESEHAEAEAWGRIQDAFRPKDWHKGLPPNWWRMRDNKAVPMEDMGQSHLGHAIKYAQKYPQHRSRLPGLTAELKRRMSTLPSRALTLSEIVSNVPNG